MKNFAVILLSIALFGCATMGGVTPFSPTDLSLVQAGATVATGAVLQFAVTDPTKRVALANQIYASGSGLYTMTGPNAALVTPTQLAAVLTSFGVSSTIVGYTSYVSSIQALYATYYSKYTSGSLTAQNLSAIINAIAAGAEAGASAYSTIPVSTPISS